MATAQHIPAPVPTQTDCPWWCTEPTGHPFDMDRMACGSIDSRLHSRPIGSAGGVTIYLSAIETLHLSVDGVRTELQRPTVEDFDVTELDADQADALAVLLQAAAVKLREIESREGHR